MRLIRYQRMHLWMTLMRLLIDELCFTIFILPVL
jgi:hypothetical protein